MRQYRIPKSTIEELKRMFEDASEHHVSEVSKVQAIQMLLPQIEVMLNKGYSVRTLLRCSLRRASWLRRSR